MIGLYFTEFTDREYLKQKIAAFLKARDSQYAESEPDLEYLSSMIAKRRLDMVTADPEKIMAGLSPEQLADIRDKKATIIVHLNRQYPRVKGEKIVSDVFTFLLEDFGQHKKGTPVLTRKTDKATMVMVFDHLEYRKGMIGFRKLKPREEREIKPKITALKGIESIILELFKGMASAVGEKIGATIFDSIFPATAEDMEKMLKNLQDNIKIIFRQELDQKTIDDLNYQITGIVSYMQETYLPFKKQGRERKDLEQDLMVQNRKMYTEVMALLIGERYRGKGIAYLVVGANAHLSIIQELASVDPTCTDPAKSSYMTTYYMRLNDYIDALQHAITDVFNDRQHYLSALQESTLKGAATDCWWFTDGWASYRSADFYNSHDCCDYKNDAKSKANEARNKYYASTFLPTIVSDLQPYNVTKDAWAKLALAKPLSVE
jgi:hypothetical protein